LTSVPHLTFFFVSWDIRTHTGTAADTPENPHGTRTGPVSGIATSAHSNPLGQGQ